jgi:hypothetical protein
MRLRAEWVVLAMMLLAAAARAETRTPGRAGASPDLRYVSDFVEPYAEMPPQLPQRRYVRALLPPQEVYAVLRDGGYAPLGVPRLRGNIWSIAAINRDGEDGRLFIDASNGRILSFMPASDRFDDEAVTGPDELPAAPPRPLPMPPMRGALHPPAEIPHVASRAVPMPQPAIPKTPMPMPKPVLPAAAAGKPVAPAAPAQSAAVETPPQASAAPPPEAASTTVGQAKPAPQILPTQPMPDAQDLEY